MLNTTLQAKEAELCRTTEQLLREKVASAKSSGELKAVKDRLEQAREQAEFLQRQLSSERRQGHRANREEEARLHSKCQHLEAELQVCL